MDHPLSGCLEIHSHNYCEGLFASEVGLEDKTSRLVTIIKLWGVFMQAWSQFVLKPIAAAISSITASAHVYALDDTRSTTVEEVIVI